MHLSEGIVEAPVLLAGAAIAAGGVIYGLRAIAPERIMGVAILASAFFVGSLIHVPIGPGSAHLVLGGIMGVTLGWACVPAIGVALLLQAIFFQYGGLTFLGVNTVIMAGPALLCGLLFRPFLSGTQRVQQLAAFAAGFLALALSCLLLAAVLVTTDQNFLLTARLLVLGHLPVMVIEGLVTVFIIRFILKVQPDILALS